MKNVLKPLAKSVLIPLGLTAVASAIDTGIHKKMLKLGMTTVIISNEEMDDIMKTFKSLEESALLKQKKQNSAVLSMLLGTLGASSLGNLLTGKRFKAKILG